MRLPLSLSLTSLILLGACSGQSGGESPSGEPAGANDFAAECAEQSSREFDLDQNAPIGFSGQDMLDLAAGTTSVTLRYGDGSETRLMLELGTEASTARFVERINEAASASTDCASQLRVAVSIDFATADGAFAEQLTAELVANQRTEAGFFLNLAVEDLAGGFDFSRFDNREYSERRVLIDAIFDGSGPRGRLQILGRTSAGAEPRITEVGLWPPRGD